MVDRTVKTLLIVLVALAVASCAATPSVETVVVVPESGPVALAGSGDRPVIAYALGSGAARGFAHVGVLNALDEAGIRPDLIVGTSSGSVVGVLYASGIRGDALTELAMELDREEVIDYSASRRGVITGNSLQAFVNEKVGNRSLEQLEVPIAVVSTDLHSGRIKVFTRGDSGLAVRAASSFPGLFRPTVIAEREYVDGGVLSPVPVNAALELGADIVVAVDVAKPPSAGREIDGWIDVLHQSYLIMARAVSAGEIANADVVIKPDMGEMSMMEFDRRQLAIEAGRKAAWRAIPRLKHVIRAKSQGIPEAPQE